MCEDCICDACEKFACCYCGCDSCSKKSCGCAICTISVCIALFILILIIILITDGENEDHPDNPVICHSIEFKPQYIICNSNNILYIDLSLEKDEYSSHSYTINLYKDDDIQTVYYKTPYLISDLNGNVSASKNITVNFSVDPGEYSLEFKDNLCDKVLYENIYVPPIKSSCEEIIIEQESAIPVRSSFPEFVIIMDISESMKDVINNFIKTIIPEVLSNLQYQTKKVTLITFSDKSNVYKYSIEQFKSSNIKSSGDTFVSDAFKNLSLSLSNFSKKISLRILTISDGQILDKENAIPILNDIYSTYYGQFQVNSRCVRVGNVEADTKIFSNILRLINPSTPIEILNVEKTESNSEIISKITEMYENDGIGNILWITSEVKNIRENPYSDYTNEVP